MDASRMTVDRGVLHHAVTPLWDEKSKAWLAQWFSDIGFTNGYGGNPANWNGNINPFTGARSYAMAHAVGQRVTSRTPDATADERKMGYRVFYIIRNPEQRIAYHSGNWEMNRRSIAIENLGDYRNYALRDKDLQAIANFFRPLDKKVGGKLYLLLHNEVIGTICPARIAEGRNKIVQYINRPPVAPPPPPPPPAPEPARAVLKWTKLDKPLAYELVRDTKLYDFNSTTWNGIREIEAFKKGQVVRIFGTVENQTLGSTYMLTEYSFTRKIANGFNRVDMQPVKVQETAPLPKVPEVESPKEGQDGFTQADRTLLQDIYKLLKSLSETLGNLFKKEG